MLVAELLMPAIWHAHLVPSTPSDHDRQHEHEGSATHPDEGLRPDQLTTENNGLTERSQFRAGLGSGRSAEK